MGNGRASVGVVRSEARESSWERRWGREGDGGCGEGREWRRWTGEWVDVGVVGVREKCQAVAMRIACCQVLEYEAGFSDCGSGRVLRLSAIVGVCGHQLCGMSGRQERRKLKYQRPTIDHDILQNRMRNLRSKRKT